MADHGYESGRLNLPFVGHATFGKAPPCTDWEAIDADVAVLGVPYDMGTQYRSGARFGPRGIREASTLFSFGHAGVYDHEDDIVYMAEDDVTMVDVGDADIVHTDTEKSHANTTAAVKAILEQGALPMILGGDHSITAPILKAYEGRGPIHIVHFDAHLDFVDERHGVRFGHGNPLRRCSEMAHVSGMTQLGIRGVSSSNKSDYDDARAAGSTILSVRQVRKLGVAGTLAKIPDGARFYVTIDIDGFDPSIAAGTGTPSPGGFLYYEVAELLQGISRKGDLVGMDLVEVAPDYDHTGSTAILAARIVLDMIGYVFVERKRRADGREAAAE
jgi:agmatinase